MFQPAAPPRLDWTVRVDKLREFSRFHHRSQSAFPPFQENIFEGLL
jgi:hypothetical protein